MSISFNRNNAQVAYESFIGADPNNLLDNKDIFKNHSLTYQEVQTLKNALRVDSINYFYNGLLTFAEGIDNVFNRRFSWATIKLYYSIYYMVRASMASKDIAILRCNNMYRLLVKSGARPFSTNNRKYNTTHEGTISHYKDVFKQSDILLSNEIEEQDVYRWMMNAREIVNYRSEVFLDPDYLDIWTIFSKCIKESKLAETLELLESDPYIMCFQEEYAVVAIPIKRIKQTISDLHSNGFLSEFGEERCKYIKKIMKYEERKLRIFKPIFDNIEI